MNKRTGSILRIVAGGYLIYLGITLIQQMQVEEPSNMTLITIFAIIFIFVGGAVCLLSLYRILRPRKTEDEQKIIKSEVEKEEEN